MSRLAPPAPARGDMLPLMDAIFLLLVVFIFMIVQMRPDFGIDVDLPQVGADSVQAKTDAKKRNVTLLIGADNQIYVHENKTSLERLIGDIKKAAGGAEQKDISIIISGDNASSYGTVATMIDRLRKQGFNKLSFAVERTEGEK